MDLQRARKNLQLIAGEQEQSDDQKTRSSSLGNQEIAGTQIPGDLGFSSTPASQDDSDAIFVNTQVQSRLDDVEQDEMVKCKLKRFKYSVDEEVPRVGLVDKPQQVKSVTNNKRKRTQKKCFDNYETSKGGKLLKQLSGKHKKVKDMIESQQRQERSAQKKRQNRTAQYDTYNAQEWKLIHEKLLERFPQSKPCEVEQVYLHLYGKEQNQELNTENLWTASQLPPESEDSKLAKPISPLAVRQNQEINLLTLSQVMSDKSFAEVEQDDDEDDNDNDDDGDASTIPDSTDEMSSIIPMVKGDNGATSTQFYTPRTSPPDEIIDLTQESFKVVKSLISPLKNNETPLVQVPATRSSTIVTNVKVPSTCTDPKKCVQFRLPKKQVTLLISKLSKDFEISTMEPSETNPVVSDTETEDNNHCHLYLRSKGPSLTKQEDSYCQYTSHLSTQSAQKLRRSIKTIGLKPSRSKSQMIASLQAASQVLDSAGDELQQRESIYDNLTALVQSCPSLLEQIYTFQPISVDDLLARLIEANPFVDHVDELTIRTWADLQGICLTNGY